MNELLETYNTLAKETTHQLEKLYKGKLEGEELDKEVHFVCLEAGVKTRMIAEKIRATCNLNEQATEVMEDIEEICKGPEEFIFEDTEFMFKELIEQNTI